MAGKNQTIDYDVLSTWLEQAISNVSTDGVTQDFHIDRIIPLSVLKKMNSQDLLKLCCTIYDTITPKIIELTSLEPQVVVYLSIDLNSSKNKFSGIPLEIRDLDCLLPPHSIPEILVYKDSYQKNVPLLEFYRTPVSFTLFDFNNNVRVFYKEYRTYYELINLEDYHRELNILINFE